MAGPDDVESQSPLSLAGEQYGKNFQGKTTTRQGLSGKPDTQDIWRNGVKTGKLM